jgi:hypothetical protein
MKMCSIPYALRKLETKQQDSITHLLKWLKYKTVSVSRDVEQQELLFGVNVK